VIAVSLLWSPTGAPPELERAWLPSQGSSEGHRGGRPASGGSDIWGPQQAGTLSRTQGLDRVVHRGV